LATEKRNLSALDVNLNVTWTNASNAYTEDDNYASGSDIGTAGNYAGGNFQDITQTPTALDDFKVRFYDINSEHTNDTYDLEVYNPDTTSWESLETFNAGNLLPTSLTTKDYTTAMQSKYSAATNKTTFLDGLQLRLYVTTKQAGPDNVNLGLAWANFTYTYSGTTPVALDGTSDAVSTVTGDIEVSKKITGTLDAAATVTGDIKVSKKITGTSDAVSTVTGDIKVAKKLTGTIAAVSSVDGDLSITTALTGTSDAVSTVTGDIKVAKKLTGTSTAVSSVNGTLSVSKKLTGTSDAVSTVTGDIKVAKKLTGTIAAVSSVNGTLSVSKKISGTIAAVSSVDGELTIVGAEVPLDGTSDAVSTVTGDIKVAKKLTGTSTAASSVNGTLSVSKKLIGSVIASSSVDATLTTFAFLSGSIIANSSTSAPELKVLKKLSGAIQATASVDGLILVIKKLTGTILGVSTVIGDLTISGGPVESEVDLPDEWMWIGNLINDEGREMTIAVPGSEANPPEDWRGNTPGPPVTATGVMVRYKAAQIDNDQIKRADKKILLAPVTAIDIEAGTKINDSLDSSSWIVKNVKKITVKSDILLYVLQVRQ